MKNQILFLLLSFIAQFAWGQRWTQNQKITLKNPSLRGEFGTQLSSNSEFLIAGNPLDAYAEGSTDKRENAGSVTVFRKLKNGSLIEQQKLTATDRSSQALFGLSVSIHDNFIAIGAPREDGGVISGEDGYYSGRVYIFQRNPSGKWTEQDKLEAPAIITNEGFGRSVSLSDSFLVIGAEEIVYIYHLENEKWVFHSKVNSSDQWPQDKFGGRVSISGDYFVVSAEDEDEDQNGVGTKAESGSCYIFKYNRSEDKWEEVQKIVASDRSFHGYFGTSLAIDGASIVVGARGNSLDEYSVDPKECSGAAYVYQLENDTWEFVEKLVASDRNEFAFFGSSVDVQGKFIVVGATYSWYNKKSNKDTSVNYGSAYVFEQVENGKWLLSSKLKPSDRRRKIQFGNSVAIEGQNAYVGAPKNSTDSNNIKFTIDAGAVFTYQMTESVSVPAELKAKNHMLIFPSPADSHIYVRSDNPELKAALEKGVVYWLRDGKGSRIAVGVVDTKGLSVSQYSPGLYTFVILHKNRFYIQTFVKN